MAEEKEKKESVNKEKQTNNYLVSIIIICLIFALGFMTSSKIKKQDVTIFTREELDRIVELQKMEDSKDSGAEIFAYKDENGNLMIGWDYSDKKQK